MQGAVYRALNTSKIGSAVITLLILVSVIGLFLETEYTDSVVLRQIGFVIAVLFGIEYALRIWTAPAAPGAPKRARIRYITSFSGIIDLLAFIPALFLLSNNSSMLLRLLRLLRLAQIMKIPHLATGITHLGRAMKDSWDELLVTFFLAVMFICLGATGMYLVEGDVQPEAFGSIPRAMWWAMATLTTVGYGDVYPITPMGKVFASFIALVGIANSDPAVNLTYTVFFALAVAFASATQDIALDAYRIEAVSLELQGAMAATYQAGYRLAMILASAGVLWIAAAVDSSEAIYDHAPWRFAYLIMAGFMAVGIITTLIVREPDVPFNKVISENEALARQAIAHWQLNEKLTQILAWLYGAIIAPFRDFIVRHGKQALLILGLIAIYRISDVVMGVMSNPFYVDMGYTKNEVATVSKVYGVLMTIVGAGLGGVLILKIGIMRTLFLGAVLSAATNLLFVWLAGRGHDVSGLIFTISADNLSAGIASCAFIAYLSGLTNSAYSATQYALFSSVMLLLPKFVAGFSGQFVDAYGYESFFIATALIGLPVLVLVWLAGKAKFEVNDTR